MFKPTSATASPSSPIWTWHIEECVRSRADRIETQQTEQKEIDTVSPNEPAVAPIEIASAVKGDVKKSQPLVANLARQIGQLV
jgi:hypothetical protein